MKQILVISVCIILLNSCKTTEVIQKTYPLNNADKVNYEGIIYALPKTKILIHVKLLRQTFIKGPYHEYTNEFLRIEEVNHSNFEKWGIDQVKISTVPEIDPENYFIAPNNPYTREKLKILKERRYVYDIFYDQITDSIQMTFKPSYDNLPLFTDLTVKSNFGEKYDTVYKKIKKDSVYINAPIIKPIFASKTLRQKAEEAANFIIKIYRNISRFTQKTSINGRRGCDKNCDAGKEQ